MERIKHILLTLLSIWYAGVIYAQSPFEGILSTRITIAGVDMSGLTEKIDYQKGDLQGQMKAFYDALPEQDASRLQGLMKESPILGMVTLMTPPTAKIYVKDKIALIKMKGLGYEIQHYHNTGSDEAFIHTASLISPDKVATAAYKPSQGYEKLFNSDKHISADNFEVERSSKTVDVAGYQCAVATYTSKSAAGAQSTTPTGMPAVEVHKLVVYSSKDLPKEINFSHPYYLPEDHGIARIDVYLDKASEPTMVYEMTTIEGAKVDDSILVPKKSEPLYALDDVNYGGKVLEIMFGGMAGLSSGDEDEGDVDEEE